MNISLAIRGVGGYERLDPTRDFIVLDDGDGQGPYLAQWLNALPVPTGEMIEQGWVNHLAQEYRAKRAAEYPPIGDQLDALWKAIAPAAGSEAEAMKMKIQEVKEKYPKPERGD